MSFQQITPIRVLRKLELGDLHVTEFMQPSDLSIGFHSHEKSILTLPLSGSFLERIERRPFVCTHPKPGHTPTYAEGYLDAMIAWLKQNVLLR